MTSDPHADFPTLDIEQAQRLDALCDAFEKAWKADTSSIPLIEDFLSRFPVDMQGTALQELLPIDRAYRQQRNAPRTLDDYRERLPHLKSQLELCFAELSSSGQRQRLAVGDVLGKYTILEWIGAGGMGEVYRAFDGALRREVALKTLHARYEWNDDAVDRIRIEARALATLNHPNIVTVYELSDHEGVACIALELLRGETLAERLRRGPLDAKVTLDLARQIVRGLAAAHERHVVHRDLKPQNIFLTHEGIPKLLDFGLVRLLRAPEHALSPLGDEGSAFETAAGARVGTPGYMSPEQVRGELVDARSDVFSFGCVLFEMLNGAAPFRRSTLAESDEAVLSQPTPESPNRSGRLTSLLDRVIGQCTQKEAARRFSSAVQLGSELDRVYEELVRRQARIRWLERGALALVGLLVIFFAARLCSETRIRKRIDGLVAAIPVLSNDSDTNLDRLKTVVRGLNQVRDENPAWAPTIEQVIRGSAGSPEHLHCLIGYLQLEGGTHHDIEMAIDSFQHALDADLDFAPAYVGLGECYYHLSNAYGSPQETMPRVQYFAHKALERNTNSAAAHVLLAIHADRFLWDWSAAEGFYRKALVLSPDSAFAHQMYGNALVLRQRRHEGIEHIRQALRQEPDAESIMDDLALAYLHSGDLSSAAREFRRALARDPQHFPAHWGLGELLLRSQEFSKAIKELQVAVQLDSSPEVRAELAYCFARIGDRRAAEAILEELKQRKLNAYVPPTALAVTLLGLDRLDEALAELERGLSERDEWLLWIDSDPAFAVLKERERFQAIRRTVGLATTVSSDAEHRPSGERGSQPPESLHP